MKKHYDRIDGTDNGIDFDAHYRIRNWPGIAWFLLGWETEPDEETVWSGYENRTGRVVAVMVGDDRHFAFDPADLQVLADDAFCRSCGQIGCKCNVYA